MVSVLAGPGTWVLPARMGTERVPVRSRARVLLAPSSDSQYRVVDARVVASGESLRTVSVTAKVVPGRALAGGLLMAVTTRSGRPTTMEPAAARQLLASLASGTSAVSSAQAR